MWHETKRLLLQERSADPQGRVLLNEKGGSLWSEEIGEEDKYHKIDNIKSAFDRLRRKTEIGKPLKSLKKTSANLLRNSDRYASVRVFFLGHAPRNVSDKHYTGAPQSLLDEAIQWLGREYGLS